MRWIGPAALGLGLVVLSPAADAERRVFGMVLDADGRPLEGVLVEAFDSDAFPNGDAFPPWPAGDEHDLMGRDVTNAAGQYRIDYPRPHGAGPGGGYWDGTISHGVTRWRPDIYIKVKVPGEGFCVPTPAASAANTHRWRFVDESSVTVDWRTRLDLPLNLKVTEFFDRSCGDFEPISRHLSAAEGELRGIVDMHTHPMAHLGFGAKLFHGAPDIGSVVPAGMFNCNATRFRATRIVEALSHCDATHGGPNFAAGTSAYNPCGDYIRHEVIKQTEAGSGAQSVHGRPSRGYSSFGSWPRRDDISHQFMWVDWVERAFRGGLRVLVALAVNNETLTRAVTGSGAMPVPFHDGENARLQIEELKQLVSRHSFMEIAYSPSGLRDIVRRNKLAVVLGIEVDDFMDLRGDQVPSASAVVANIRRWHEQGVRYIFPVHVTDNAFGGTAAYMDLFAIANRVQFGHWWSLECAADTTDITYQYEPFEIPTSIQDIDTNVAEGVALKALAAVKLGLHPADFQPLPNASACPGHRNARGLQSAGRVALREMMRLGMIIDIDHMSEYTVNDTLDVAEAFNYPLSSGHSGLRARSEVGAENAHTPAQYRRMARLGGMAGVGWSDQTPCEFLAGLEAVRDAGDGIGLAFGTDANGTVVAPVIEVRDRTSDRDLTDAACVNRDRSTANDLSYSESGFPMARTGRRKFNYNTEGVAHYGLMADFVVHLDRLDTGDTVEHLFGGAENFARMWEKADFMRDRWPGIVAAAVL